MLISLSIRSSFVPKLLLFSLFMHLSLKADKPVSSFQVNTLGRLFDIVQTRNYAAFEAQKESFRKYINEQEPGSKSTMLHFAAKGNDLKMVKNLIALGADVNAKDVNSDTPVHWAGYKGHLDVLKVCLDNGGVLTNRNNQGRTPLLESLLIQNTPVKRCYRVTPEQEACARLLLEKSPDITVKDHEGNNLLHIAFNSGASIDFINHVLQFKNGEYAQILLNGLNKLQQTPLRVAGLLLSMEIQLGNHDAVKKLIGLGAHVNALDSNGETPLHWAAAFGPEYIIDLLIENKALLNIRNKDGMTPLVIALLKKEHECAEKLLEKGADASLKDNQRKDALYYAQVNGANEKVLSLINKSIEINK